MVVSVTAALASATLFALTTNLQRQVASGVPRHRGPLRLLARLFTDPRWLMTAPIGAVALGFHALALAQGSVMVVQVVMSLGLVLALALEAVRERRAMPPTDLLAAGFVVVGVVTVVAVGRAPHHPAVGSWTATAVCGVIVLVGLAAVVGSRHGIGGATGAWLLAGCAGACFAADAVFLQRLAGVIARVLAVLDPTAVPVIWPGRRNGLSDTLLVAASALPADLAGVVGIAVDVVGFLAAALVGGLAVHRAYQVAPLRLVQPAVAATEPVTAFVIGLAVLGEGVRGGVAGYLLAATAVGLIVCGIMLPILPEWRRPATPEGDGGRGDGDDQGRRSRGRRATTRS